MSDTPSDPRRSTAHLRADMSLADLRRALGGVELHPVKPKLRFVTGRAIMALLLRHMQASYGRNPGGYIWAILEPAAGLILLTTLFSAGFRTPALGTNFAIFFASGYLPYNMFSKVSGSLISSLRSTRGLLGFPRITIADTLTARLVLEILTQLLISCIIFAAILSIHDTRTVLKMPELILAYTMAASLGLGVGLLNCFLITRFVMWGTAWGIISRPLMLLSGVIFLYDGIPQPYRDWLWWNPLVHVTGMARKAFYISYHADYVTPVYVFTVAGVCAVTGAVFLRRYHRDIMEMF